jgi:hypothetical protein
MKKGILPKLSMGLALAGACVLSQASRVLAAGELGDTVTFMEPARALVMPFDETTNKKSFQIVTRTGGDDTGVGVIATHWSYWSKDCDHLADVFICLTRKDTVVVDPTALQSEIQSPNPPVNNKVGPIINLTGQKGMLTVTAFEADTGSSGLGCNVSAPDATVADAIVGAWTIANTTTNAAFGNDAIGLDAAGENGGGGDLPSAATFLGDDTTRIPFYIETFNPSSLTDSEVILITVENSITSGNGRFQGFEIGPFSQNGSPKVCCDLSYIDNLEINTSLPDFCFDCVGFAPISDNVAEAGEVSLIPPITTVTTSGTLEISNCSSLAPAEVDVSGLSSIGANSDGLQFLFGFHGQAVGPFGSVMKAKYTGGLTL